MTVNITGEYNTIIFPRQVFGISPDDLEECDLPAQSEQVAFGQLFDDEDELHLSLDAFHAEIMDGMAGSNMMKVLSGKVNN